ncbi:MAG: hypothetical protein QM490_01830 [Candidatus Gracilibacteria bacterium]
MLSKYNQSLYEKTKNKIKKDNNQSKKNIKRDYKIFSFRFGKADEVTSKILNAVALFITVVAVGLFTYFKMTA